MATNLPAVTDATFATDVIAKSHEKPVIVDFWAAWCGPCRQITPILEELSAVTDSDLVEIVAIDGDANPATMQAANISGLPTINVYSRGQLVQSITGAKPKAALLNELSPYL